MDRRGDAGFQDPAPSTPGIAEAARRLGGDARALGAAAETRARDLVDRVVSFAMRRPLGAIAIAFGVGFALGGGLVNRSASRLLRAGMRLGGIALTRRLFAEAARAA